VVKGSVGLAPRGYLYLGNDEYQCDRAADGRISTATLQGGLGIRDSLTFTCVPPRSGRRIAIDRDNDGILDGDDPRLN
jgi:hypothetical protein